MIKNDIRSTPKQVREALQNCGMYLIVQRCDQANRLPHAENHHHRGWWRAIICGTYPETIEDRVELESGSSRHLVDRCRSTRKDAIAAVLTQLGWTDEAVEYAGGLHAHNIETLGYCLSKACPVCTNQLTGKTPTATADGE